MLLIGEQEMGILLVTSILRSILLSLNQTLLNFTAVSATMMYIFYTTVSSRSNNNASCVEYENPRCHEKERANESLYGRPTLGPEIIPLSIILLSYEHLLAES